MIKVLVSTMPAETVAGVRYEPAGKVSGSNRTDEYFRISHVGMVLATGEHNWHDDSDFYAVVWNPVTGRPEEIEYATTRGWTYANSATIDATPGIRAEYDAYRATLARERQEARDALEAATPYAGKIVRVVRGRKVPVGTVAEVIWYGAGRDYGHRARYGGTPPMRVGLKVNGERVFTDAGNVQVVS
jgi:hypothetical protein